MKMYYTVVGWVSEINATGYVGGGEGMYVQLRWPNR